ncbi:TPA: hypothetical protein N8Z84_004362 [Escherichia coli]|nr:hypothetical protein [Escherichia coli]HCO8674839.1 hypothetical protein [Escherichia coli]
MSNDDKSVSDEISDFHNKVKNITTAQFSAYLKHVGANHNCLSCGKAELIAVQDWHWDKFNSKEGKTDLNNIEKYTVLRLYKVDAPHSNEQWNMTKENLMDYEFRVICKHCGFVTSYLAWLVFYWLKNNEVDQ